MDVHEGVHEGMHSCIVAAHLHLQSKCKRPHLWNAVISSLIAANSPPVNSRSAAFFSRGPFMVCTWCGCCSAFKVATTAHAT